MVSSMRPAKGGSHIDTNFFFRIIFTHYISWIMDKSSDAES